MTPEEIHAGDYYINYKGVPCYVKKIADGSVLYCAALQLGFDEIDQEEDTAAFAAEQRRQLDREELTTGPIDLPPDN